MVDTIQEYLEDSLAKTMEDMFFQEVLPDDQTVVPDFVTGSYRWARVRVLEPMRGALTVVFPVSALKELVSQLMPGIEDVPEQVQTDTLAEMVNILIGRFMNLVVPTGKTFNLSVPENGTGKPEIEGNPEVSSFLMGEVDFYVMLERDEDWSV